MRVQLLYLLDASSVIGVHDTYYPCDRVPEFWEWLEFQSRKGVCKIPPSIFAEIKPENEKFNSWIESNKMNLVLAKVEDLELVRYVKAEGYGENLTEVEIEKIGADPFLIASALEVPGHRCVVTHEISRPKRKRANRHIPDICDQLGVSWMNTVDFIYALDFKTRWKKEIPQSDLDLHLGPRNPQLF